MEVFFMPTSIPSMSKAATTGLSSSPKLSAAPFGDDKSSPVIVMPAKNLLAFALDRQVHG
jgi:hypothetical protein